MSDEPDAARPTLGGGLDDHDADAHNRRSAHDILSGSPFGATVHGYKQLHASMSPAPARERWTVAL